MDDLIYFLEYDYKIDSVFILILLIVIESLARGCTDGVCFYKTMVFISVL